MDSSAVASLFRSYQRFNIQILSMILSRKRVFELRFTSTCRLYCFKCSGQRAVHIQEASASISQIELVQNDLLAALPKI
jgi:hypothetical protein